MPESWAGYFFFPSSSSWANKSSDLPLCIISSTCLGALPGLGGAPTFQPFLGWGIYSCSGQHPPPSPWPGSVFSPPQMGLPGLGSV